MKKGNDFVIKICANSLLLIRILGIIAFCFTVGFFYTNNLLLVLGTLFSLFLCLLLCLCSKENNQSDYETTFDEVAIRHSDLITIVKKNADLLIRKLKQEDENYSIFLSNKLDLDWILWFDKELNSIEENRINGKPDTFIEAACLINAILNSNCITSNFDHEDLLIQKIQDRLLLSTNIELAFQVAFEMIANPITFKRTSDNEWIEEKHELGSNKIITPKNIVVPNGIISKSTLYERIMDSMCKDFKSNCPISTMQLSNILHLLYLYNRDCNEF